METESTHESVPEIEEPKPKSYLSRLGGVYASPREAFGEIGSSPRVLVPIIVLICLGLLTSFVLIKILDLESMGASLMEGMSQQGNMTQEQMDRAMAMASRIAGSQIVFQYLIGGLFNALIVAAFVKLFSAAVGAKNRFKTIFSVTLYSITAILAIRYALLIIIVYLKRPEDVTVVNLSFYVATHLGGILSSFAGEDALPKFFMNLANYIDALTIWLIALLSIGYSAVSQKLKVSTAATWLAVGYGVIALIGAVYLSRLS